MTGRRGQQGHAGYRTWLWLALAATVAGCGGGGDAEPMRVEPTGNLVMVAIDTVRYDSMLERGIEDGLTPWLDAAVSYANASTTGPWTMPSVASVLTGLYPVEHGAGRFEAQPANLDVHVPSALAAQALTLPEILLTAGFRTGAFVSHPFFGVELGLRQGFEQFDSRKGWDQDLERLGAWLDALEPGQRWFGYLHFMEAHDQHLKPTEYLEQYLAGVDPRVLEGLRAAYPGNCSIDQRSERCLKSLVYEVSVLEMRRAVAAVLAELEARGVLADTTVLVYSDHGEEFYEHEAVQVARDEDPRGFRGLGHGQSLFEELLHIPLLLWHPALAGQVVEAPVSLVDVLPTVLHLLGVADPGIDFSGRLLPPLGAGRAADDALFASGIAYGFEQIAVRRGSEKSIYHLGREEMEVFDLAADPGEHAPLVDQGLVFELESLTGDYLEMPARYAGATGELSAGEIEDLKAIGYLQGVEGEGAEQAQPESEGAPQKQ